MGRDTTTGTVQQIPQSRFAKPADIDTAIIDWVGTAPANLNTLIELGNAINNDASFAANINNQLTLKAPLANPIFTGTISASNGVFNNLLGVGEQTFSFTDALVKSGVGTINQDAIFSLHVTGSGLGVFGFDFSALRFVIGSHGGKPIDFCTNVGGTPDADNLVNATAIMRIIGNNIICPVLPTSPIGLAAGTLWKNGNTINIV